MENNDKIDISALDNIITGRVAPKIYAFTTQTIPNHLKIGDTYRPLEIRLEEWRKYFPNLEKKFEEIAKVDEDTFFRDHAIHHYLEKEKQKERLLPNALDKILYYSKEFFKDTSKNDLVEAIKDIKKGYKNNINKYQYYKFNKSRIPVSHTYIRKEDYEPRPNQQATIDRFKEAINKGRTNLLMYAVMRFGKSFTSLCCALEMKAKIVLVVSAKADVKDEWKRTTESHLKFKDYVFLDGNDLLQSDSIVKEKQKSGKKIVLFLTLQDLQGDKIKSKHKEIFQKKVDLLIIDETHFGARAEEYGKILRTPLSSKEEKDESKLDDNKLEDLEKIVKIIKARIRLHLSGTPYRILMNSEFTKEDIIAFYQFSNIAEGQAKWDEDNLQNEEKNEWDNPYYGFPKMIRFAFNPNISSQKKMEELKRNGITYAFSALFKPVLITKDLTNNLHKKFEHEKEIVELLKVIDGTKADKNILNFLEYKKIKEGNMCRHIVCVLPFRASCDALENLIKKNKFKNLSSYKIINISGVDGDKNYKTTQSVQSEIKECEHKNIKTITLTVNRMLTGSTVPQWDTMLYLKDTSSPQEYDQAIFRLQNQYVKEYKSHDGDIVKYNMKPQTLLVDFNPNRMFQMQEYKSQIYNVNTESNGNSQLEERIRRELAISPIIVLNKNKIVEIKPADIIDAVRQYSSSRSVLDEAVSIGIDLSLLNIKEIKSEIEKQNEIGSKQGFEIKSADGEGVDIDIDETDIENTNKETSSSAKEEDKEKENYEKKFAMYYAKILFFAFLTESKASSLEDIINVIDKNKDNQRIVANIGIKKDILILFQKYINPFILSELDYKIQNINTLANDLSLEPIERASNAMKKFTRLSDSEIVTPEFMADKIISALPEKNITKTAKLLDIASKQGEFVYSVYKKYGKDVANNFYSIPTSKIAYEFTRKVYRLLELDIKNIEEKYTSYDLIQGKNAIINGINMKFNVIVGNPPYQQSDGGAQASAKPIYNEFVNIAKKLNPDLISIIMPTRWYSGGKGLDVFRDEMLNDIRIAELHDFLKPDLVFKNVNLRGGVCYFLWDKNYDNTKKLTKVFTYNNDLNPEINIRSLKNKDSEILIRHNIAIEISSKIKNHNKFKSLEEYISPRKPFNFEANIIKNKEIFKSTEKGLKEPVICYGKNKKVGYIERKKITKNTDWINKYKVFTPRANNIGTELNDDNLNTFIGAPNTICTESYIVVGANLNLNKISTSNICKYFSTKFVRFMHSISKASQDATSKTYQFVPLQDFNSKSDIDWKNSIKDIDKQLYKKYKLTREEVKFIEDMIKPMN
jgi:hypothetical protein